MKKPQTVAKLVELGAIALANKPTVFGTERTLLDKCRIQLFSKVGTEIEIRFELLQS